MKRKLLACTTSLMLLLSVLLVGNVNAHPVIVFDTQTELFDRTRADWFAAEPADPGNAMIARNSLGWGEFIFNDYKGDQRLITTTLNITRSTDIDWFSITSDSTYASFLTKMDRINGALANPQVELMISVSTNQASGHTALPDTVGVTLTTAAAWEYVIQTNFNSTPTGNFVDPRIWTGTGPTTSVSNCSECEAQLTGASNGGVPGSFIEIKVPWNKIGGKPAPNDIRRFTLTTYYKGHALNVIPNDGHPNSALIDVASTTEKTKDVLDQGQVNSYFDVHFDVGGEVFSPLLISEFNPNPSGSEPGPNGTEWIELYNPPENNVTLQLNDYKLGDTTNKNSGSEAILRFPSKTLNPGDIVIVARDKAVPPIGTVPAAPNLTIYNMSQLSLYGGTGVVGLDNKRDQIVLFDGRDTIADFVEYNEAGNANPPFTNSVPYVFPPAGAPDGNQYSYERCPAGSDTNNAAVDFQQHDTFGTGGAPTPGQPCPPATGVDLNIQKIAQPSVVLAGGTVNFFIEWSNNGNGAFTSVVVSDTLPANITLNSQSSKPAAAFTQNGQNLSWNFTNLNTNAVSGTIVLTATVSPSAVANVPLVNTAGVRSNDPNRVEDTFKLGDNVAEASVTPSKPDMAVSSTWPGGATSGSTVSYAITYANNGTGAASNVVVTDTLPVGVTFQPIGSTPPSTIGGQVLTWNRGDLDPGGSGTITVKAIINAPAPTPLTNVIAVGASPPDDPTATDDNTESHTLVVGATPDLQVSSSGWPAKASPGTQFCYTINYSYPQGAIAASDITIKDVLPFGLTLASQSSTPGLTFSASGSTLTWTRAAMNVGQSGSIQVCVNVRPDVVVGAKVNNVITIEGSVDPDPNAVGNKETKQLEFDKHKVYIPVVRKP